MEVGIVGLPYTGKSTLFKALSGVESDVHAAAAGRQVIAVAKIPDPRLGVLARDIPTKVIIPAELRVVDAPGLVRGASEGAGMGNAFLTHVRDVDALLHVVRCFTTAPGGVDVPHVDGSIDPVRDMETVEIELILADLQMVENAIPRAEKAARRRDATDAAARLELLKRYKPVLDEGLPARTVELRDERESKLARGLTLLSAKPMLYVANIDEHDAPEGGELARLVREHAEAVGAGSVAVCAEVDAELTELDEADRAEMLESMGLTEPAISTLARGAYGLLGLQSFYTAGPKEIRAWTVPAGATAPEAAGVIHSDLQRGFIRAEIYSVSDLEELHSEKAIKEAGRLRVEGKHYVMQDGDVAHILFNV